jgi:hypothetical protein
MIDKPTGTAMLGLSNIKMLAAANIRRKGNNKR